MKVSGQKAFTLIELLVVIAILGILTTVVLVSIGSAREKANDAAVKANLNSLQKQMELYYARNGNYGLSYGTGCPVNTTYTTAVFGSDPVVFSALKEAIKNGDSTNNNTTYSNTYCSAVPAVPSTNAWAVAVTFKNGQSSWCVDSTGVSKQFPGVALAALDLSSIKAKCR